MNQLKTKKTAPTHVVFLSVWGVVWNPKVAQGRPYPCADVALSPDAAAHAVAPRSAGGRGFDSVQGLTVTLSL